MSNAHRWRAGLVVGLSAVAVAVAASAIAIAMAAVAPRPVSGNIPGGAFPDALAISPNGRVLYIGDQLASDDPATADGVVWPLDLATGRRGPAIKVKGPAFRLAIRPDGHMLYSTDGDAITPIDLATGQPGPPIRTGLAPGPGSLPILMSRDGRTLFIAGQARIRRYNLVTGRFGPDLRADWPEAMLISRDDHTLWYASHDNQILAIDLRTGAVKARIRLKKNPVALALTPDGRTLYVAVPGSGNNSPAEVLPVSTATARTGAGIRAHDPVALAMAPNGRTLYVLATPRGTEGDGPTVRGSVTPITLATRRTGHPIPVGYAPTAIAIAPGSRKLYVANTDSETISVIPIRH